MTDMNKSETISTSTPETSTAIKNGQKTPPQLLLNPPTNPAFAKLAASKALSPNGNDERIRDLWTNGSSDQKGEFCFTLSLLCGCMFFSISFTYNSLRDQL